MCGIGKISFQAPTVICKHVYVPVSLIPFFHLPKILVESLSLFFAIITTIAGKVIQVRTQKMHFHRHPKSKGSKAFKLLLNLFFIIRTSVLTQKVRNHYPKSCPCSFLYCTCVSSKTFVLGQFTNLLPIKDSCS